MNNHDKAKIMTCLMALGTDKTAILASLRKKGVKGVRMVSNQCLLANLIGQECNLKVSISKAQDTKLNINDLMSSYIVGSQVIIDNYPLRVIVDEFDAGLYRDLIR